MPHQSIYFDDDEWQWLNDQDGSNSGTIRKALRVYRDEKNEGTA